MIFGGRRKTTNSEASENQVASLPEILVTALTKSEVDAVIVLPGDKVIFQSPGVETLSIVRDGRLTDDEVLTLIRQVRRDGKTRKQNIEIALGPIGSGRRSLHLSAAQLNDEKWIILYIVDESEQKRVDTVRRDFVANVSHELKTPIGAISLLSEAILGAKDDPEAVARFASRMQTEAERLSGLVQEIINLSRLQSEDSLDQAESIQIDRVISEAIFQSMPHAEARKIEITSQNNPALYVRGNTSQLVMAVHNLIENGINYSPDRTKVSVSTELSDGLVEIRVTDQGIGIAESEQARIFERFYRVDPARSRETGGTGLGLSIVKHIAENHGGEVTVWSRQGVGSTFALRLPLLTKDQQPSVNDVKVGEA